MPPKNPVISQIRIETLDGYVQLENAELIDITQETEQIETEQERLNRIAWETVKSVLPDNMELVKK